MGNKASHLQNIFKSDVDFDVPDELLLPVEHIAQKSNWDCGIACLCMLCSYSNNNITDDVVQKSIDKHGLRETVWSIDLAYLCCSLGLQHKYCTTTIGVDAGYQDEEFYAGRIGAEEQKRVNLLFENAAAQNVNVENKSVSLQDIIVHLAEHNQPLIALIDDTKLERKRDKISTLCEKLQNTKLNVEEQGGPSVEHAYWGHYILVIGYNLKTETIIFHDPSANGCETQCTIKSFEAARKSYGTDEDILFVYKNTT